MEHIFKRKLIIFIVIWLTAVIRSVSGQTGSEIIGLILKGEYQRAQEGLQQIQKTGSESPDTILFLQGLLSTDGENAAGYYQKLLSTYPNSQYCDDATFRLAQLAYARGAYKSALSLFRELMTGYPNSNLLPACRQWQSLCMKAMGQSDNEIPETTRPAKEPGLDEILGVIENDTNKKPNIAPVTSTPVQASPAYAIQVNAFAEQNRALLQKSFFEKNGYFVSLGTKVKNNQTLYLVWVGALSTKEQALNLKDEIKDKFGISGFVVSTQ